MNYYNEYEPFAAQWLRNLIDAGLIPAGHVDTRSITDVQPDDLTGYRQCHFFAGIGGWSLAARLAGWPDDRELWTGSCPCQPFSVAGKGKAQDDDRHLWPHFFRLIGARRPAVIMGEQVAAAVGKNWLDGVSDDLEGIDYTSRAVIVPACAVDAPHRRDRLWFVARPSLVGDSGSTGLEGHARDGKSESRWSQQNRSAATSSDSRMLADTNSLTRRQGCANDLGCDQGSGSEPRAGSSCGNSGCGDVADSDRNGRESGNASVEAARHWGATQPVSGAGMWGNAAWIIGHDGKARRVEPGVCLLAHGVPARVGRLRAYGNAIVPQVAAEVIGAFMDCYPEIANG